MIWLHADPMFRLLAHQTTHRKTEKERHLLTGEKGVRGWTRSRIIRPQESLALYKSFNTLCVTVSNLVKFFMMIFRSYGFWISALNKADNARLSAPGQKKLERQICGSREQYFRQSFKELEKPTQKILCPSGLVRLFCRYAKF
jgi:hypothetical protein